MGDSRTYDLLGDFGNIAEFVQAAKEITERKGEGALARELKPKGTSGQINVVGDYPWTLSNTRRPDIPWIRLIEYKCNEGTIKKQLDFYSKLIPDKIGINAGTKETLSVYDEIFPKDHPTDFSYWFPYFNKVGFELNSPNWTQLDSIGESLKGIAGGASTIASSLGFKGASTLIEGATKLVGVASSVADAALMWNYPSVGVQDRPRIFAGHSERQTTISFPLYNTIRQDDWIKNRSLIYTLMSQNLFNKRDYITGIPPVFYDIYVPGQYYCFAASMTNIQVENLGNTRLVDGDFIVPDAYQVTLTLTEMTMPSKNQFEAITSGAARKFVDSSTVLAEQETNVVDVSRSATNPDAKIMPQPTPSSAPKARSATNPNAKVLPRE
jgi:hypothetical protein